MRHVVTAALVVLATSFPAAAQEASDPATGGALAQRWCSGCHLVDAQQARANDAAPPFAAIAAAPATSSASLHAFLSMPHAPMPDLKLSGQQIDNVVAYILSLRQH